MHRDNIRRHHPHHACSLHIALHVGLSPALDAVWVLHARGLTASPFLALPPGCSGEAYCNCAEVGLVTALNFNRNNVSVTLPTALETLMPLTCSLKGLLARWNPITGEGGRGEDRG